MSLGPVSLGHIRYQNSLPYLTFKCRAFHKLVYTVTYENMLLTKLIAKCQNITFRLGARQQACLSPMQSFPKSIHKHNY